MDKTSFRYSITTQLIIRCVLILTCTVLFNLIANIFFLERYYIESKKERLLDVYGAIYEFSTTKETYALENEIARMCGTYNINYIVTDASSNTIMTSINDPQAFNQTLRDIILSSSTDNIDIITETDNYFIGTIKDDNKNLNYLTMWGNLYNGNFFMIRTPIEAIRESVNLFNGFVFNVGALSLVFSILVIYFVSRQITKPIIELTKISKKMSKLDFSAKYKNYNNNEIDTLGENFNAMSDTLEHTIAELKTANAHLKEDVENSIRIDNMRREFIANVSHDLKTPIALISGYAEGLKESINDDPESRDFYCEVIMDEAKKMNHMVKQLMKLTSIESGANLPEFSHFDIDELIRNGINSSELLIKEEVDVQFVTDNKKHFVWADEFEIEEVFRNYFSNALNHVENERKIKISVEEQEGNIVKVSIYNTGKQIPEASIEHIWDKFYKVDKARTREYGGSGVGLSIVKAIMEAHSGGYGVQNEEDGVSFWFTLSTK